MIELEIKVEQLENVINFLENGHPRIQEKVDEQLEVGAGIVADQARQLAPFRTEYLRSTIGFERQAPLHWIVYAGAYYAGFVEYGTSKMAARPYMRPALALTQPTILALAKLGIAKVFEERG